MNVNDCGESVNTSVRDCVWCMCSERIDMCMDSPYCASVPENKEPYSINQAPPQCSSNSVVVATTCNHLTYSLQNSTSKFNLIFGFKFQIKV